MSWWATRGETRGKKESVVFESRMSLTTLREQNLYLFDIVASLCAGFNEHDIQFLSSLLALLRGDLSAQVEAEGGRWTNRQIWKETSQRGRAKRRGKRWREKQRESSTQNLFLGWKREREVSLVITDREEDKGREAAVLSKDEAAGKWLHRSPIHSTVALWSIYNEYMELYIFQTSQLGLPDLKDIGTCAGNSQDHLSVYTCCCWTPTCLTL